MKRFYLLSLSILLSLLIGSNSVAFAQTTTFRYVGNIQTYVVPAGILSLSVNLIGGCGGGGYVSSSSFGPNSLGGQVSGVVSVLPGQTIYVYVGQAGTNCQNGSTAAAAWNGGGQGGTFAAGGGGGTDIRTSTTGYSSANVIMVAGGAGGGGDFTISSNTPGGAGGGLTGGAGLYVGATSACGGGQSGPSCTNGAVQGTQGNGAGNGSYSEGGGGGGWYGGNQGGSDGGGGGGSGYVNNTFCTNTNMITGSAVANGNGLAIIIPLCAAPVAGTITGSTSACIGQSTTLSDVGGSVDGKWASSNTAVATVGSLTGSVTGISSGFAIITYVINHGLCGTLTPSVTVSVNPPPLPISGMTNICTATPSTFTTLSSGGVWSSSNTAYATIDPTLGIATGILPGFPTISYTFPTTGCSATISTSVNVSPNVYTLSGGGPYCAGGTPPHIILSNSDVLVNYQLIRGTTVVSTVPGAGHYLDFGPVPTSGSYTVLATNTNGGCSLSMAGTVTVTVNSGPTPNNITGATTYCAGGAGVNMGLDGSVPGVSYQLYLGTGLVGAPFTGTGSPFSFPFSATLAGTYTIVGTVPATGCSSAMTGSKVLTINPAPPIGTVTGSGNFCAGTGGRAIGVTSAIGGIYYDLYLGSTMIASVQAEALGALSFGNYSAVGTYTVQAVNHVTGCSSNMVGYAAIDTMPLPAVYSVIGGGSYCAGSPGVDIGLAYSAPGIHYQLMNGSIMEGAYKVGSGVPLDFGLQYAAGSYYVVATNPITGCMQNMAGTPGVVRNLLPNVYTVMNGATSSYCADGAGVDIFMNNSDPGINYELYKGSLLTSIVASSGGGFDFGPQPLAGTYTALASNPVTGCSVNMGGTATVSINPLPTPFPVSGGGNFCAGGTGVAVVLNGSTPGINYQVSIGGVPTGSTITGTGAALSFNSETTSGSYGIVAHNPVTGCNNTMSGSVSVTPNPLPYPFNVTGGGIYCTGGVGFHVGLDYSNTGVTYQLLNGTAPYGAAIEGTGSNIDFGLISATGLFTVAARNDITGCTSVMAGSATITSIALPTVFSVTGGGNYCAGGPGVPFGLGGSTIGIEYMLYDGATVVDSLEGTGLSINFGLQTLPGSYSVVAVNPISHCTSNMSGGGLVAVNPLPSSYTVSGGGSYCQNGTGVNVYLNGSSTGVSYQLENGSLPTGAAVSGTGASLNFGLQTVAGPYTVVAKDNTTHCTSTMTGAAAVSVNALPVPYTVTGGGAYCAGGTGVHVGLSGSNVGMNYQLNNGAPVGIPVALSGGSIDFGLLTAAGTYSVTATDAVTGCATTMNGSVTVEINPLPPVHSVTGGGSFCADGSGVLLGISGSDNGIGYQMYNGTIPVGILWPGTGSAINFGIIGVPGTYTVVAQDLASYCTNNMASSATVVINPLVYPAVSLSTSPATTVCAGTSVTLMSTGSNGGTMPGYQWKVNGTPVTGAASANYSYVPANGDVVTLTLTSSNVCARPASVTSAPVNLLVNPIGTPNVSVTANTGNMVCNGTNVIYTAAPVFGGLNPAYLWKRNGIPVGTDSTYYSYIPENGDNIFCTMTTNYPCPTLPIVYSNQINMIVDTPQTPVVTVIAVPGTTVNPGTNVSFAVSVNNSGSSISYQWMKNNIAITGATNNTYMSSNIANGDVIGCTVTNENVCGMQSGMNSVDMTVRNNLAVSQVGNGGNNIALSPNPNKGEFILKGTLSTTANEEVSVEVANMLGQIVYSNKIISRNGIIDERIQVNNTLANGNYILNLRSGSDNAVIHFVVQQ